MTLVIALEYGNPDDIVTFSPYAAAQPDVQLNAAAGEQYRLKDLLYIMMLRSYNDVAVAVAEHIGEAHGGGGTKDADEITVRKKEESRLYVSNFAHLMNEKPVSSAVRIRILLRRTDLMRKTITGYILPRHMIWR